MFVLPNKISQSINQSHVWFYPRIIVSKSYENTSKYVDTVTIFPKTSTKGHWLLNDFWPYVCWGHMCDSTQDHCVQVPRKYIKICGYSDLFFSKTWTKGLWPLDDLWLHVCWGHMCDSTQGSLCPSPMGIHQSMLIQWPIRKR